MLCVTLLLALKCRSFDTPMWGVFKPGYDGSSCRDVAGGVIVRIPNIATACTGKLEA